VYLLALPVPLSVNWSEQSTDKSKLVDSVSADVSLDAGMYNNVVNYNCYLVNKLSSPYNII